MQDAKIAWIEPPVLEHSASRPGVAGVFLNHFRRPRPDPPDLPVLQRLVVLVDYLDAGIRPYRANPLVAARGNRGDEAGLVGSVHVDDLGREHRQRSLTQGCGERRAEAAER